MTFCLDEKIEVFGQTIVAKFNISSYNYNCPLCGRYDGGIYDIRQLKILARRHLKKSHGLGSPVKQKEQQKETTMTNQQTSPVDYRFHSLPEIVNVIRADWKKVNFAAVPYLQAMGMLNTIQNNYGLDSGVSIVLYFLSNATSWKGEIGRASCRERV